MSQYLTNFYCGNKRGLCNYNEPVNYETLLNRNFDPTLHKMLEDCKGAEFEKGYCCDPTNKELQKPMDDEYMEKMNRKFEANIFTKDENDFFHKGQIPLIKPLTQNGKLKAMEVCTCGGESADYVKCVSENCSDFRPPTRYEYCKMGPSLNKINCVVREEEETAPSPSGEQKTEATTKSAAERCKLEPVHRESQYTYSHQFKINNLFPDCYLNLCNKTPRMQMLDQLVSSSTTDENKYYSIKGDSLDTYHLQDSKEELNRKHEAGQDSSKSLLGMFRH